MLRSKYDIKPIAGGIFVVRRDGATAQVYLDAEPRGGGRFDWDTACGVIDAVNELENRPATRRRSKFHILRFNKPRA